MTEKQALERLCELASNGTIDITISEHEDKPFAIAGGWEDVHSIGVHLHDLLDDVDAPDDKYDDSAIGTLFPWQWGFSDEWDTCPHCYKVIRTSPDCYGWTPDYWMSDYEMACGDCVREDLSEEYIDWLLYNAEKGEAVGCYLLDPADYNFTRIAERLENGLHHGQNDDPRTIAAWGSNNSLQVMFSVFPSQFDVSFDVWVRDAEGEMLNEDQVQAIKSALFEDPDARYPILRREFKQWPTPAQRMEEGLKNPVVHQVSTRDFIDGKALDHSIDAPVVQIVIG